MKSGSVTFERCVIAAGVVVSVAAWWRKVEPLPEEPDDVPFDDAARRAGDFELELTRARRAPRSRRFATSLAFASLFFAGAAFTAGAGNELIKSHTDEPAAATRRGTRGRARRRTRGRTRGRARRRARCCACTGGDARSA